MSITPDAAMKKLEQASRVRRKVSHCQRAIQEYTQEMERRGASQETIKIGVERIRKAFKDMSQK